MLKAEDFRGDTWKRLEAHLRVRLTELREANDAVGHDQTKTAAIRGQIAAVKELLALRTTRSASIDVDPFDEGAR